MSEESFNLATAKIDQQLFYRLPYAFLEKHQLIPICEPRPGVIQVAMADPDDIETLDELKRVITSELEIVKASPDEIAEAAELCHRYGAKLDLAVNTIISDEEAEEFCEYIKASGYKIYVLSNASDLFYQYFPRFLLS